MAKVTIYHNPRCSKSREALALLRQKGVELEVIEYLNEPLYQDTVLVLAELVGGAHKLVRRQEPAYKECRLSEESTPAEIADAIAAHPALMERPVVVCRGRAAIGRPPENALSVL